LEELKIIWRGRHLLFQGLKGRGERAYTIFTFPLGGSSSSKGYDPQVRLSPSNKIFEIDSSDIPAFIGKGGSTIKDL